MNFRTNFIIVLMLSGSICGFSQNVHAEDVFADSIDVGIEQQTKIENLVTQLGSNQFASRERAATALMQMGTPALAVLAKREKSTEDPEVRDRISGLVKQITESNTQAKIDRFMAGQEVDFEGWNRFGELMGDTVTARELFVEVHLEHPDLLRSLGQDAKELQRAMDIVDAKIQNRMFVKRQHPSRADTIALLLPAFNPKVSFSPGYENTIVGVLDRLSAQQMRRDPRLEPGLRSLIGSWVSRCTLAGRVETLTKAMQWDVPEALPIAISTLSETDDMQTLVVSMQTIARFGDAKDSASLKNLLTDNRVTGEAGYGKQQLIQTQVRDVAIATIAILNDVPLAEVGFPQASTHAMFGFTILGIGFPKSQEANRNKSLLRIAEMISPTPTNGS
ncbi:hypothetical protein LF1_49910 [Rubripirellula obstinata]|uniref:HEAT repeat protein n=1 Tax=Rubripirellula obstinata TaxID=406547 RepID=A0A5B1CML6_9BACT|nr:hypothetical protein [Rubripirellula obstinata]KAA1262427.1 hypothetical protein LF1_49910 [Rubripirellula obstinata]